MRTNSDFLNNTAHDDDHQEPGPLSESQRSAISCLLECSSISAAADKCGINFRTLQKWLQIPDFVEELNKTRRQHFNQVAAHLQSAANDAAETLMRLLKCGDPLIELRAAKIILQTSQKTLENAESEKRGEDLERSNAILEEKIEKLELDNKELIDYKEQFRSIMKSLTAGTFRRPDWVSALAWEKIIHAS